VSRTYTLSTEIACHVAREWRFCILAIAYTAVTTLSTQATVGLACVIAHATAGTGVTKFESVAFVFDFLIVKIKVL
jgi:hypothetical protein